jgi:aspartate aminotransferase
MRRFADRLTALAPSATLAMAGHAARLQRQGRRIFPFTLGEPDFDTPPHVREAAKRAIDRGETRYTAVAGSAELRSAICAATERDRGFRPAPNHVVVGCGAKHVLWNLAHVLYEPGDEVVIPAPYWASYPDHARAMGATPVIVETRAEDGYRLRPEALAAALTERTKAFVLNSPANPTGAVYAAEDLGPLAEVLRRHDCWIIVDEIYADLAYDGAVPASLAAVAEDLRDRLAVVSGVSKTFSMTGWRIGWSITPPELAAALELVMGQSTTNAGSVSQAAAVAALTGPRDELHAMRAAFARRRALMVQGLAALPGVRCRMPEAAFYAFADVRALLGKSHAGKPLATDTDLALWLLEQAHVACVPGSPFGAPGHLRFSYACSEQDIDDGLAAMGEALATLS